MRLVLKYVVTDDCTYSCEETVPVEYASPEAFLHDFLQEAEAAFTRQQSTFQFAGKTFSPDAFFHRLESRSSEEFAAHRVVRVQGWPFLWVAPEVMTVDQWFASSLTTIGVRYHNGGDS